MTPADLGKRRTAAGLTQTRLAELADVPQPHISAMEAGRRGIGPTTGARLDRALGEAETARAARRESMRRCVARAMDTPKLRMMREMARMEAEIEQLQTTNNH